jgi:hypothetical protein
MDRFEIIGDSLPKMTHSCSWLGILSGVEYYYWLKDVLNDAKKSIDIAMFFMAIPLRITQLWS